jgi:3-oxoadipate enol-lactonase
MRASINGYNVHYILSGSAGGHPVTFVHGFPFSLEMWSAQTDAVTGAGFRTLAYDVRGHGSSDVGDGQYTIEAHVDDLFALLDQLKIERTAIVGLSMGGYIALRALEREPARFSAVVLCDTKSEADNDEGRIRRATSARMVKKSGSAAYAAEYVKSMFTEESFTARRAAVESIRQIIARTPPLSIAGTLIALAARTDTSHSLASIAVPALILVGEKDAVTPLPSAQSMHEKIRGSELHVVPAAAHLSNIENPAFFNEKLLSFLKQSLPGS